MPVAPSPQEPRNLSSVGGASGSPVLDTSAAPQNFPSTTIGVATEARTPKSLTNLAPTWLVVTDSSFRAGSPVCRTAATQLCSPTTIDSPTRGLGGRSVQDATRVAVPSASY